MKKLIVFGAAMGFSAAMVISAAEAKENWEKMCQKCHGPDGKGQTKMGQKAGVKDFSDTKVQDELKDDAAFKAIKDGLKDKDDKTLMKPFAELSDDEIKALVQYVRAFKK